MNLPRGARDAVVATLGYAVLTLVMTWPLVRGLARDIPGDFGDPLLNAWILAWDSDRIVRALGGHPSALADYWNANIFYPAPLALAYSEHLTAQALQIFPVWAVTRNPVLCYNLVFLGTFVLSGLGMFLWARELTGRRGVAFVAGLAFAFAPYRLGALPHLQVLSAAWMPFTLFGLRRFFESHRARALGGASLAWVLQNLSCGYYLLYFSLFVLGYIAWEMTARRLWSSRAMLQKLAIAGVLILLATIPFLVPYYSLRQLGFPPRSLDEVDRYSADVYGYLTADEGLRLSGWLHTFSKAEGTLFPGFTVGLLAIAATILVWRRASRQAGDAMETRGRRLATALGWLVAAALAVLVAMLFGWTLHASLGPLSMKITSFDRALAITVAVVAAWLAASPPARRTVRGWLQSPVGIVSVLTLFSMVMSFGPHIDSWGRTIEENNLYKAFYLWVPGFDGVRVPARFAMIVTLGLATLAAYGLAAAAEGRRRGRLIVALAGVLILLEGVGVPLPLNAYSSAYRQSGLTPLPRTIGTGRDTPAVYRFVNNALPASATIVELPFGEVAFDVRYQFYSTAHWRRLVNGYSGGEPTSYGLLRESLKDVFTRPDRAWEALTMFRPTHAIVHEASYADDRGQRVSGWLRSHGALEIAAIGGDRVFQLPFRRD